MMFVTAAEVTKHQSEYGFGIRELTDLFDRASHEAVTIMIFFQILSVSFFILKFSSILNLLIWLSFAFLMYTIAGPYLFLKWFLGISSLIWHGFLLLWTHPYLIATCFLFYATFCLFRYMFKHPIHRELSEDTTLKCIALKLNVLEEQNSELFQQLSNISNALGTLEEKNVHQLLLNGNDNTSRSHELPAVSSSTISDNSVSTNSSEGVSYPLDRRRSVALAKRQKRIDSRKKQTSSD